MSKIAVKTSMGIALIDDRYEKMDRAKQAVRNVALRNYYAPKRASRNTYVLVNFCSGGSAGSSWNYTIVNDGRILQRGSMIVCG